MIKLIDYNLEKDFGVQDDREERLIFNFESVFKDQFFSRIEGDLIRNPPNHNIFMSTATAAENIALYQQRR